MTSLRGFAPVRDTALHYEVAGAGNPIVLIHGFSLDLRMWDDQVTALAGRYQVVRYDLRGFGKSGPGTDSYTHAEDLEGLLDHLELPRVTLVALSLGGGAAINFAIEKPERVHALILVDPSLGGFSWSPEFVAAQAGVRATAQESGLDAARDRWLSSPLFEPALANVDSAEKLRTLVADYSGWHWVNRDRGRSFKPPAIQRLGEIRAPTLVIVGELDVPDFQGIAATLEGAIPGARKVTLKGAGHMANLEQPDRFNDTVMGFLKVL